MLLFQAIPMVSVESSKGASYFCLFVSRLTSGLYNIHIPIIDNDCNWHHKL